MAKNNIGSIFLAFLTGTAVGTAIGILFAPEEGSQTRDKLSYQLSKYKERLKLLRNEILQGRDQALISEAKYEGEKVITEVEHEAHQLEQKLEALERQIRQTNGQTSASSKQKKSPKE
ncbi:MAG: YtxH domain-containing protein [Cytophagales bacterium]|nr:MAG: YtxH domain-containing protein [Cytophagales bacterium]